VYKNGHLIKSAVFDPNKLYPASPVSFPSPTLAPANYSKFNTKTLDENGDIGDILDAITCVMTGGRYTGFKTPCNYGNGWGAAIIGFIVSIFGDGSGDGGGGESSGAGETGDIPPIDGYYNTTSSDESSADVNIAGGMVYITVNPPCDGPSIAGPSDDPNSPPADPCAGVSPQWIVFPVPPPQVAGVDYMAPDQTDDDPDNNPDGGYDNTVYPDYQDGTPWPTVPNVISKSNFVIYDNSDCLVLAKRQIAQLGYTISDYNTPGQTIQAYTEAGGVNSTNTKLAVSYINSALSRGIPVIVGVDGFTSTSTHIVKKGNLRTDASTDHFIVIVGMGTDSKGNFYEFYDSSTTIKADGTSDNNKLYYNGSTGTISGNTSSQYDNAAKQAMPGHDYYHPYIMTQVRKSK